MANFLDLIKGEGLAVQVIKSLVNTGVPGSLILQQVRDMGLGIRTQTGYQVINYLTTVVQPSKPYISNLTLNSYPTISRLPLSLTKQLRNFSYNVTVRGFNQSTGELQDKFVHVSTNTLLTKQQAIDAAVNMSMGENKSGGLEGGTGVVTEVTQNSAGLVTL